MLLQLLGSDSSDATHTGTYRMAENKYNNRKAMYRRLAGNRRRRGQARKQPDSSKGDNL